MIKFTEITTEQLRDIYNNPSSEISNQYFSQFKHYVYSSFRERAKVLNRKYEDVHTEAEDFTQEFFLIFWNNVPKILEKGVKPHGAVISAFKFFEKKTNYLKGARHPEMQRQREKLCGGLSALTLKAIEDKGKQFQVIDDTEEVDKVMGSLCLSDIEKRVMRYRFGLGLTQKELKEKLGISLRQVKKHLETIRELLGGLDAT
jgi:RNA polymerase sigma factor (sigma-70 family)